MGKKKKRKREKEKREETPYTWKWFFHFNFVQFCVFLCQLLMTKFSLPKSCLSWGLGRLSDAKLWNVIHWDCPAEVSHTPKANKGFGVFKASGRSSWTPHRKTKQIKNQTHNQKSHLLLYLEEGDVRSLNSAAFQNEAKTPSNT